MLHINGAGGEWLVRVALCMMGGRGSRIGGGMLGVENVKRQCQYPLFFTELVEAVQHVDQSRRFRSVSVKIHKCESVLGMSLSYAVIHSVMSVSPVS